MSLVPRFIMTKLSPTPRAMHDPVCGSAPV
jgi:hypothetical protein